MEFNGKTAVVIGGGNGIGRSLSLELARRGANVVVADLEEEAASATALDVDRSGGRSLAARVDVSREGDLLDLAERVWDELGGAQLLFNVAGVLPTPGPLLETSYDDFRWVFDVNVGGTLNGIRAFGPRFAASEQASRIINFGSEHSFGVPHVMAALYTGSKHAVLGISDVLRRELPHNVGVSVVCPGFVASSLWRASERRTDAHGGATKAPEGGETMQALAMPVEGVASHVLDRVALDDFLIVTHSHVVDIARARWEDVSAAFAEQAPRYEGDERYDVNKILSEVLSSGSTS